MCPNCFFHPQIIVAVSFGTQIKQIYKKASSSHQCESPRDPIPTSFLLASFEQARCYYFQMNI